MLLEKVLVPSPRPTHRLTSKNCVFAGADAAKALALALRAALESQPNEGTESAAELHKQVISRKKLAKIVVVRRLTLPAVQCNANVTTLSRAPLHTCQWRGRLRQTP